MRTYNKVLVTGGAGFIGSHLVNRLVDLGLDVVVYDDLSNGVKNNINDKAIFIEGDVNESNKLYNACKNVDIIFHLAAKVSIRNADNFLQDAETNILGTLNVFNAMLKANVKKIIFASSMAVYSETKVNTTILETDSNDPISPYGIGKLAAERYLLNLSSRFGRECVILRYFNTYGTGQKTSPYVGVINIFIENVLKKQPISIYGDGEQIRDYVSVKDIVEANIKSMQFQGKNSIFNIGTGIGTSVNALKDKIMALIKITVPVEKLPARPEELRFSVANIEEARSHLNYLPREDLDEGIQKLIIWKKKQLQL